MFLFLNKSIVYRLWFCFSILGLLIMGLGIFSSISLKKIGKYPEEIYSKPLHTINFARLVQSDYLKLELSYAEVMNSEANSEIRRNFDQTLHEAIIDIEDFLQIINERALSNKVRQKVKTIQGDLFKLEGMLIAARNETIINPAINSLLKKLEVDIEYIVETTSLDGFVFIQSVNDEIRTQQYIVNFVVIVSIFVAIALSYSLGKDQVVRLKSVSNALTSLAGGKKNIDIPYTKRLDEFGDMARAAASFQVATNDYQRKIEEMAFYDNLTGLPNRNIFEDRLSQMVKKSSREKQKFMIALLDLDKFKPINDTLGHQAGDIVLQTISQRLASTIRVSDTVARLGGDEFVLLLGNQESVDGAEILSKRILEAVSRPIEVCGKEVSVGVSIGLSRYPDHGVDVDTLIKKADEAMYEAKSDRCGWRIYNNKQQGKKYG